MFKFRRKLNNINQDHLIMGIAAALSISVFLVASKYISGIGFPLDDAWIHQTFARNFSQNLRWAFQPGSLSGGSTGPLWGFILTVIYLIGLPPVWSTFVLGFFLLWFCGIASYCFIIHIFPGKGKLALIAGLLVILEWHMIWAALSGMETIIYILLVILLFVWLFSKHENWWLPGMMIGLSAWVRPDGLLLLGPALFCLLFRAKNIKEAAQNISWLIGGFLILAGPYFMFNWIVAGDVWPNTFYAKQAEYAVLRETEYFSRYLNLLKQFITGVGVFLVPGMFIELWKSIKDRMETQIAALLWFMGYVGIYSWHLPVTYQHGRYIMPAMSIGFLLGLAGMYRIYQTPNRQFAVRIIKPSWIASTVILLLIFWGLGARAYGMDVAVINTEMIKTAKWIKDNTPQNSIIAAHDIGALGYFGERKILDLAGLVSPDVIPFIRDEKQLKSYLDQSGADYLMTFPGWYPYLVLDLPEIYSTGSKYSPIFGMDNMTVYKWEKK